MTKPGIAVGRSVPRVDADAKLRGVAKYIDDLRLPGCLYGVTVRSTIAFGAIKKIEFDPCCPWKEAVIATTKDIPGENCVAVIEADQPLLAPGRVLHPMEPILLVAHPDRNMVWQALRHVKVTYEEMDPVLSIEESLARKQLLRGTDNVFKEYLIEHGDIAKGFAAADFIVQGEYRTQAQEHAYIEPNAMAAWVEADGTIVVAGSMQCPFYVQKALKRIFPDRNIRVMQAVTGGAFGGKEDYPSMLAGHVALLAVKSRRPVKMLYDRSEDMASTTKRHPSVVRHRTGLTRDGRLTAQDIDVLFDGGAYLTLSPVVLSRGTLHATGPYACPNVRVRSRAMATNTPPNGAFRGFGAPQTLFAAETHWEKIAAETGLDPLALRRKNLVRPGSVLATGQVLKESVSASEALERCVRICSYDKTRRRYSAANRKPGPVWRGIGLALVHHGPGFTGSGEVTLASRAAVALEADGTVSVLAATTEMGQGEATVLAQIVAETLGLDMALVRVATPDTAKVPNSGPTVASRTTMIIGGILMKAAAKLKEAVAEELGAFPTTAAGLKKAARKLCAKGPLHVEEEYQKPPEVVWNETAYRGDAYGVYGYEAIAVDLSVDRVTYEVKVRRVTASTDVGRAIHPDLVRGQIAGGTVQGLGWALTENTVFSRGRMVNSQFTNYIIPTFADAPDMDLDIIENPYSRGPYGAKGIGELPHNAPAPAVAAAVRHATGLLVPDLPILPEKICHGLLAKGRKGS
ncbi:MAG: xanthine dehydrogenase family protein molybdopterin-binding subunit [Elusimicrobiota bacterium]|jgi:CO/xanthine dehydrogenase Mo-binding subunit